MPLTTVQVGAGWFSENPGGLDRYYHDLIEALPEAGVGCRGLVVGTARVDEEADGSVRAFAGPTEPVRRRMRAARDAVSRLWTAVPPDDAKVLVTHFAQYAYPLLADRARRPWVVHFHGPWAAESKAEGAGRLAVWRHGRMERAVYRQAGRLIVLSRASGDLLAGTYGVDPAKIIVIPCGVDCDRFAEAIAVPKADARRQFGWPVDRPIVLSVRRLTHGMGLETLVDAVAKVRQKVPNVLCVVAGRGPLAEPLVQRIEAAGLADAITLLGFVPDGDLPLAYRAADVSVVPSQQPEAFGLTAAESLAAGTPVVVTPVGGLPEVVGDLSKSLIAADATAAALADPLAAILTDPLSAPASAACAAYAAARFDWPVIARRIAAVYAEVAAKPA